jgi:hypothetical protein
MAAGLGALVPKLRHLRFHTSLAFASLTLVLQVFGLQSFVKPEDIPAPDS